MKGSTTPTIYHTIPYHTYQMTSTDTSLTHITSTCHYIIYIPVCATHSVLSLISIEWSQLQNVGKLQRLCNLPGANVGALSSAVSASSPSTPSSSTTPTTSTDVSSARLAVGGRGSIGPVIHRRSVAVQPVSSPGKTNVVTNTTPSASAAVSALPSIAETNAKASTPSTPTSTISQSSTPTSPSADVAISSSAAAATMAPIPNTSASTQVGRSSGAQVSTPSSGLAPTPGHASTSRQGGSSSGSMDSVGVTESPKKLAMTDVASPTSAAVAAAAAAEPFLGEEVTVSEPRRAAAAAKLRARPQAGSGDAIEFVGQSALRKTNKSHKLTTAVWEDHPTGRSAAPSVSTMDGSKPRGEIWRQYHESSEEKQQRAGFNLRATAQAKDTRYHIIRLIVFVHTITYFTQTRCLLTQCTGGFLCLRCHRLQHVMYVIA
jgi:hypothetical protein